MKPEDSEAADAELLQRYRAANDARPLQPSEASRTAILAEARRIAEAQSRAEAIKPFDTRRPAANQSRWRMAAFGSVGAVVCAALLMVPAYRRAGPNPKDPTAQALQQVEQEKRLPAPGAAVAPAAPEVAARPEAPEADRLHAQERNAIAPAPAPAPSMEAKSEASARAPRPPGAAGAASTDKAAAQQSLDGISVAASRQRAGAATDRPAEALVAPMAKMGPAAPRAYSALPSQALSRAAPRAEPSPVLAAVRQGDLALLNRLLEAGASTAESDDAGRGPLLLAIQARRVDLARALLAHGADPNAADREGQRPLAAAHEQNLDELVSALKQAGAREP